MGRIRVLSDSLINRIAAGEVVDRPASVVKELVENSLDAGAKTIEIRLNGGGRQLIEIRDDGCGMDRDDALLAVERHATSKVCSPGDLDVIRSFGFRGEALASIAAVSNFRLETAIEDGEGTRVVVRGGRISEVATVGLPRGTAIRVERLFVNVPARRKFLRSEATELAQGMRWISRYALARPDVRWITEHGGRRLIEAPPASDLRERAAQLLGPETARHMLTIDLSRDGARVHGLAGRPVDAHVGRDHQHLFVNGRAVQDRVLTHGLAEAYRNNLAHGRHPAAILFVEIGPEAFDVNVHPQKTEVRFHRPGSVHDLVRDAVAEALGQDRAVPRFGELRPGPMDDHERNPRSREGFESGKTYPMAGEPSPFPVRPPTSQRPTEVREASVGSQPGLQLAEPGAAPRVLGQLHSSYILAQDREGLVVVDQHAAHERVLFERLLGATESSAVESQALLFPKTIEFAPHQWPTISEQIGEFRRLGFGIEPFGGASVRVDSVPTMTVGLDVERLILDLLGAVQEAKSVTATIPELRRRLITTAACHSAITIRVALELEEMRRLLRDLYATDNPTTCPHGRPILFRMGLDEIERAFRRR